MGFIVKALVILLLFFILFSLGSALYFLVQDKDQSTRMVKALTWRISLSLVLFILLMIAFSANWLSPHSI